MNEVDPQVLSWKDNQEAMLGKKAKWKKKKKSKITEHNVCCDPSFVKKKILNISIVYVCVAYTSVHVYIFIYLGDLEYTHT